jgi:hypothetical protein
MWSVPSCGVTSRRRWSRWRGWALAERARASSRANAKFHRRATRRSAAGNSSSNRASNRVPTQTTRRCCFLLTDLDLNLNSDLNSDDYEVTLFSSRVLRFRHVQFRQTENTWRLDCSYRGGNCCDIPCLVDAAALCAVAPIGKSVLAAVPLSLKHHDSEPAAALAVAVEHPALDRSARDEKTVMDPAGPVERPDIKAFVEGRAPSEPRERS